MNAQRARGGQPATPSTSHEDAGGAERLAAIIEAAEDAIHSESLDGTIVTWNASAERLFGYTREEAVGRPVWMITPPERLGEVERILSSFRAGKRVDQFATQRIRKDGSLVDISLTVSPLRDAEGKVVAAASIARDMTDQRRLEEQLRQSQKLEAIGTLASGVAHDFNNVLTIIRGHARLLLATLADDDRRHRHAAQIDDAAELATALTRRLLAFGRQLVLQPEPTSLTAVTRDTLRLVSRVIGENIELIEELADEPTTIVVDRGELQQVIINLCVNARDAMANGGRLLVRTRPTTLDAQYAAEHLGVTPGDYALLEIADSGAGMDEETRSKVFDPFFTTKEEGTGLGLATVYGIVAQSGGHIWLYSEPGHGTTFKVYFPVTAEAVADRPRTSAEADAAREGTETILLVEDAEMLRPLVAEALESFGYQVLPAASAEEAVALTRLPSTRVDLLLTDVVMPGANGRELAERLLAERPSMRVLFTSGYPRDILDRHTIAEARVAFIQKPYLADELAAKVRSVLDGRD